MSREDKFEHQFPFYRVSFADFLKCVKTARELDDGQVDISIENLEKGFAPLKTFASELANRDSFFV
jgi:hypothetical protein